ncbi:MAG: glycosyltransferase family 2 protein [Candidatus Sumerlaeia bacterium]|nr:glycosyltransferase family 2 protein [Candidatus Sumerlaeia bacterium]
MAENANPAEQDSLARTAPYERHLSVVIPFYNEAENIDLVCREVHSVIEPHFAGRWELVMVNDGSRDGTGEAMRRVRREFPHMRAVHLRKNSGQSAALEAGFLHARGEFIATLDGDGQNDPRDIPKLLEERAKRNVDMMCGIRAKRKDSFIRRFSSRTANRLRRAVLQDGITDVGCSIRVFRRDCVDKIRFFRNAHRFFPALFVMKGFTIAETPVNHRPRASGVSKYGLGINSRLWVGIADLLGVYWMRKRALRYRTFEDP